MLYLACHESIGRTGELVLIVRVKEGVLSIRRVVEALIGMHARTIDAEDGLWHKGGIEAKGLRDSLDGVA